MANSLLSYLFSLIGFAPINQQKLLQLQQQPQPQQQLQQQNIQQNTQQQQHLNDDEEEEECEYLASSTFLVEPLNEKKNNDWLFNLSKMALFKILTTTIEDYPQVANTIYDKHYNKKKDDVEELKHLRQQVRKIAHSLDKQRPSEQFGRASEISFNLNQILYSTMIEHQESLTSLFGLILLAQESLNCPSEVRQHLFSNAKFGRIIILEISKILKNFNEYNCRDFNHKWSLISTNDDTWFDSLQYVCNKLSRYDITWEYRKEYQDVIVISKRYFK
ncbi:hypothetical protein MFLAVUS_004747 [Mucor flavus]|uniref:Uncharacterized protein n=1 Tax=Mucor flavus TaxID=439312 RepID=A0ABP9YWS4_9FUNG